MRDELYLTVLVRVQKLFEGYPRELAVPGKSLCEIRIQDDQK